MKKLVILCLLCLFGMVSTASAQYAGGDGEGHVNTLLSTSFPAFLNLFTGTDGDGYDDASSEPSDAATRYVAPSGEDAFNNCTDQTQPCVTIAQAVSQANPGDTLDLAAGTYTLSMSLLIDKALTIQGQGVVVQ